LTSVFFLFLFHAGLGLLVALPFVDERAGVSFFKFCSAAAAFMGSAGLMLLLRRFGLASAGDAPLGTAYTGLLASVSASLLCTILYNRAWHFSWRRLRGPLLAGALGCGVLGIWLGAPPAQRPLVMAADLTSVLLLGAAASAMVLGHWYLVVFELPIAALRRLTRMLIVALTLRGLAVGAALAGPVHAALDDARMVAAGLWSPDGVFVWMRLLFGIAGPLSLLYFIWKTVEIRSTQSATGILYVQLFLVLAGELLAKYLRVAAGLPL
jgi:protein NrfD